MPKKKISNKYPLFGLHLKQYRVACGLTQEQVASVLNISRTTYTKYETGISEPSFEILGRIVSLLGTDFNSVLGGKNKYEGSIYDTKMPMFNLTKDEQRIVTAYRSFSNDEKSRLDKTIHEVLTDRKNLLRA